MISALSVLVAMVILSIKTSLILGTSWLTKVQAFIGATVLGGILFGTTMIAEPFTDSLNAYLHKYTFEVSIIIALLFIYLGISNREDHCEAGKRMKSSIIAFLPCPFCLIALSLTITIASTSLQIKLWQISLLAAIAFTIINMILILLIKSKLFSRKLKTGEIFNGVLIFMGIVTIVLSLVIPNYVKAAQMSFSHITIPALNMMIVVLIVSICIIGLGYLCSISKQKH